MVQNIINYQELVNDTMQIIVRKALEYIWNDRLPGEHHFYISFLTSAPSVVVSDRIKAKYPQEMTIVLQHQFENFKAGQDRFFVTLTFDGIREHLEVPYAALTSFSDPSAKFTLTFNPQIHIKQNNTKQLKHDHVAALQKSEKFDIKAEPIKSNFNEQEYSNVIFLDKFRKKK